jgi:hypothetical protein
MKLAVVGSRDFDNYDLLKKVLDNIGDIDVIVSGGAEGADKLSEKYARENNIKLEIYRPDWKNNGKAAGFIRNVDIWNNADEGVAFWDGKSKGTAHSFEISKKQNKKIHIIKYNDIDTNIERDK